MIMKEPSRNESCPCGSGKKYKKCCFMDDKKKFELLRAIRLAEKPEDIKTILSETLKIYVFKVELLRIPYREITEEISCIIELNGKNSLYQLHLSIQGAFDWDNNHMFSFYLGKDEYDRENEYTANPLGEHIISTFSEPTKSASDTQIRDLNLYLGREFTYLFDYGDQILHKVKVVDIRESESSELNRNKVISKTGKAPEQYYWGEEE
ncbi:hypothetical protein CHISP_2746 [Chitinispirillum alkaliphilum]|nr:hypothetical protein CHISP_2746 [Chitinispirillum alkaliphilum]